jgi:hypothetical protein
VTAGCNRSLIAVPTALNLTKCLFNTHTVFLLVGRSRDRSPVVSLGILCEANNGTMCPGVDSASKNEYQENSWE